MDFDSDGSGTRRVPLGSSFATILTFPSLQLYCTAGPDQGRKWLLEEPVTRIGTAPGVDLRLTDPSVSRVHAQFKSTRAGWVIEDLGSTNGVVVNENRVTGAPLVEATRVRLGSTVLECTPRCEEIIAPPRREDQYEGVIGSSAAFREVAGILSRVAPLKASILLSGPTGCGKGILARAIHNGSRRATKPFLVLDCGNLDTHLVQSELFGHEKGAFTGAERERAGVFEAANGGTVFIDEIGELPLELQPRLLRVLEDREVCRIGSHKPAPVNARIVAASHRNLRHLVAEGKFREDLFFRLCVVEVEIPALAARVDDILPLTRHFLEQAGESHRLPLLHDVQEALMKHPWPGNVRELRNVLERAVALAGPDPLLVEHLRLKGPAEVPRSAPAAVPAAPASTMAAIEREAIIKALGENGFNLAGSARKLGIAVTTLRRRMLKFRIGRPEQADSNEPGGTGSPRRG